MTALFKRYLVPLTLLFVLTFAVCGSAAQDSSDAAHPEQSQAGAATSPDNSAHEESAGPNGGVGEILEQSTEKAAHQAEKWGRKFGLGHDTSYLISVLLNFAAIALLFYVLVKGSVPQLLRDRTISIQRGIREAQAASAEATERLNGVEARLAKLDGEIAAIRTEAEKQAVAEEQRNRVAAEEDKHRVVESAKIEIDAIARNARRELKTYASTLAVDIAAKRIHVDDNADQALVREFVDQLGKGGRQ
jgi:F-type H+-transporting ATPase subunit b